MAKKATLQDFKKRLDAIDTEIFPLLEQEKQSFSFRVNNHLSSKEDLKKSLQEEGFNEFEEAPLQDSFLAPFSQRKLITKTQTYTQNKLYIQSLSSIFAALALDVQEDDWVLDLAAAPGGKSLIFSEQARKVSSVEPDKSRFFAMKRNFKKMGAKNIQTYNKDGRFIYKATGELFDRVFLDAPCSSEAHIEIKKGITWWNERRIYKFAKLQKELIISAFESLKSGGEMIYATCTFAPEENEAVVNFLLEKYSNAAIVPIEYNLDGVIKSGKTRWREEEYKSQLQQTLRFLPKEGFSGFFMAKIKKLG